MHSHQQSGRSDTSDLYLTYLDVLDEEDRALAGEDCNAPDLLRSEYTEARRNNTVDAAAAESRFAASLFSRLHQRKRSAICFSGGGIRSATFGLGILQGLAARSRQFRGARPHLLGEFDFLSTVSGGGYLGSWFSAWATRLSRPGIASLKKCAQTDSVDGSAAVIRQLAKAPDAGFEPEPAPVRYLRAYTNYLAPRLGTLSGDTWTLAATVLRNMFLNWVVLLPLFAAVLLIPVFSWHALWLSPAQVPSGVLWFMIASALGLGAAATSYIGYDLPNAGNCRRCYKAFLWGCLLPLSLAAIHLNTFWAWLPMGDANAPWWNLVALGKSGIRWWHLGIFGALMHGGGMLTGITYVSTRYGRPPRTIGLAATLAAALTGFIAGVAALWATNLAPIGPTGVVLYPRVYAALGFPAVMAIFMLGGTLVVGATSYITEDEDREWWARAGGWVMLLALSWCVFAVIVLYASRTLAWVDLRMNAWFTGLTGITGWAASRLGASSTTSSGRRDTTGRIGPLASNRFIKEYGARSLMLVFLVLLAMLLAGVNEQVIRVLGDLPYRAAAFLPPYFEPFSCAAIPVIGLMAAYLALCLGASGFINVNKFSLHGMYRLRLIRAYLGASNTARNPHQFTGFDENDNIPMCALTASKPLHVLNMTVNLVAGRNLAWQQRKAEPFTSTRLHTGSCRVGYRSSALYGGRQNDRNPITLGTAITISGAAASPNMGYHSSPLLTLVMTLFNARLGWWLGNPRKPEKIWRRPGPRWGILPFMEEAFGLTTDENSWLYLSDGGHFENLGIYEMVLRRCSLIVVSDAGADPGYVYEDLANAVRKIRIDLGIPIEFDNPSMPMSPGRKPSKERTGHHCAIGRIHYGAVDPGAAPGTIVYIKASLNGNEPPDVQQYAATDATFPHQSTTDQFFDEAQFESYRRLGLHVIEEICGNPRAGLDLDEFVTLAEQYAAAPLTARARVPATLAS